MHPEDAELGFKIRKTRIAAVKAPPELCIKISDGVNEETIPVPELVCDHCNAALPDGSPAVAVSMWRDGELAEWEHEYTQ